MIHYILHTVSSHTVAYIMTSLSSALINRKKLKLGEYREATQDNEGVNCNAVMCWAVLLGFSIHGFSQLGVKNMQKIIGVLSLHKLLPFLLKQYSTAAAYTVFLLYLVLSGDDLMRIKGDAQSCAIFL